MGPVSSTSNLSPTFPALNFSSASAPAAKRTNQPNRSTMSRQAQPHYTNNQDYNQFLYANNHFNF
jgi:hypothetical protein